MKNLSTAGVMLGASLAAGCEGNMDVGHALDGRISEKQCYENLTDHTRSIESQTDVVSNPDNNDAYVTQYGEFHDTLRIIKEGVDIVVIAAIGRLDKETNSLDIASTATGIVEQDFGNGSTSDSSDELFVTLDFTDEASLDNTRIDVLATDPTCNMNYNKDGDVFNYDIEDQRGQNDEDPFYQVVSEE